MKNRRVHKKCDKLNITGNAILREPVSITYYNAILCRFGSSIKWPTNNQKAILGQVTPIWNDIYPERFTKPPYPSLMDPNALSSF